MKIVVFWFATSLLGCGGGAEGAAEQGATEPPGGEQAAPPVSAADAGPPTEGLLTPTDPAATTLDEPPPRAEQTPTTLTGREGVPAEGIVREEARAEGGVRLVAALPASADGGAVFEIQTTPARSGGLAVFALRAVHPAAQWASCSTLSFEIDGRTVALQDVRVLAGADIGGVLEAVRAPAEIRVARRLAAARVFRVAACDESFEPPAAARPILARFVARFDELSRAPAAPSAPTPAR